MKAFKSGKKRRESVSVRSHRLISITNDLLPTSCLLTGLTQPEECLKITIWRRTRSFLPIRRCAHQPVALRLCLHRCQLWRCATSSLLPLAGCMKRVCHRPLTAVMMTKNNNSEKNKTKPNNLKRGFFFFFWNWE